MLWGALKSSRKIFEKYSHRVSEEKWATKPNTPEGGGPPLIGWTVQQSGCWIVLGQDTGPHTECKGECVWLVTSPTEYLAWIQVKVWTWWALWGVRIEWKALYECTSIHRWCFNTSGSPSHFGTWLQRLAASLRSDISFWWRPYFLFQSTGVEFRVIGSISRVFIYLN